MNKTRKQARSIKYGIGIIVIAFFLGVLTFFYGVHSNPYKAEFFEELGYNTSEIAFILSLDDSEKETLLRKDRLENIIKHYTIEHYSDLTHLAYSDEEIDEILQLNAGLLSFVLSHQRIEDLFVWLQHDNFIPTNYERYTTHKANNPSTKLASIIEQVNTYRDAPFYTLIFDTDTEMQERMLVNKYFALSETYVPKNLVSIAPFGVVQLDKVAAEAFVALCTQAKNDGYTIFGISGYRSYQTQDNLYQRYLKIDPQWIVDSYSARPGHSEHQTGLAIDVSSSDSNMLTFENSSSFPWMKANAHRFGFILRYQKGKEDITGYKYEPWHYRYVGIEIAQTLYETGMTFDEYYVLHLSNDSSKD